MTHDPLCRWQGSTEFDTVLSCDECDLIAKVREEQRIGIEAVAYFAQRDMLAKCIEALRAQWPDPCVSMCGGCRVCWACMEWARAHDVLCALQEQ
jgi:hypothetical protein